MKIEHVHKQSTKEGCTFWIFDIPEGITLTGEGRIEEHFGTIVKSFGVIKKHKALVVEYSKDSVVASAHKGLEVVMQKLKCTKRFKTPMPLDRVHLQNWGYWWTDQERDRAAEPFLDILRGEAPEAVVARLHKDYSTLTAETEVQNREELLDTISTQLRLLTPNVSEGVVTSLCNDADTCTAKMETVECQVREHRGAGRFQEAQSLEDELQQHSERLDEIFTQIRQLTAGSLLMLEAPEGSEPSSSSTDLSVGVSRLDAQFANVEDREETVKERLEEINQRDLIQWVYGEPPDTLLVNVRPHMLQERRVEYIQSLNPNASPLEFARLYMDLNLQERFLTPGRNAVSACKEANRLYSASFDYSILSAEEKRRYVAICHEYSSCAVCGRSMVKDKIHCSKKCADNACECCNGPMERKVSEQSVWDFERSTKINELEYILKLKGLRKPVAFAEQVKKYHKACQVKVSCPPACEECQPLHDEWRQQQDDWKKYAALAREPESFWDAKQQQLESLQETPERTTESVKLRVCASGCTGTQRADKRSRDADQRHREMVEGLDMGAKRRRM